MIVAVPGHTLLLFIRVFELVFFKKKNTPKLPKLRYKGKQNRPIYKDGNIHSAQMGYNARARPGRSLFCCLSGLKNMVVGNKPQVIYRP